MLGRSQDQAHGRVGPEPSVIQVAKPYVFETTIQECMTNNGVNEVKEDSLRLQGVGWIDNVRRELQLYPDPLLYFAIVKLIKRKTYAEYGFIDAAGAALFTACKIEDTLKKSKDILCAAYNSKVAPAEHLSPDDSIFENHSKTIIGLERLMLEASGFDFRNRYPQKLLVKLAKGCGVDKRTVGRTAYDMSLDLYRTFAPLKQSSSTMAIACLELSARMHEQYAENRLGEDVIDYRKWNTSREEVMETLLDLLDLFTHHRSATVIGPQHTLEAFIAVRITLNQEATQHRYPRFTQWPAKPPKATSNGTKPAPDERDSLSPTSRRDQSRRGRAAERGRDGTVRFMLDAVRAKEEQGVVAEFFKVEEEEYVVEEDVVQRPTARR
ncbi:MAG: RNA polymerase II C-terminal domain kinase beta subunit [Thelocarpon impressellum]|nr:MAG: RNA polymerase II C-terminal domain kinase beta subunit [Thelocarpon impressellum]